MRRPGVALFIVVLIGAVLVAPSFARLFYPFHHRDLIQVNAWRYDLDPSLVAAVIRVESGFDPEAESRKGALGLMQIMPETGRWVASQIELEPFEVEDLLDPAINIQIGTWYLSDLLRVFDNDLELALAAYNGGRGNVRRWLENEQLSDPDSRSLDQFPFTETRNFVRKVLVNYRIYKLLYS